MSFSRRLTGLFRRRNVEAEMAEEMRFHLEQRAAEYETHGLPADEAHYAAQRRFGNLGVLQEAAREARGFGGFLRLLKDLRIGVRQLFRNPGSSLVAILTLGLGIGASTAIFSIIDSTLLRPLPFPRPEQLVQVWQRGPTGEPGFNALFFFKQWRDHCKLLDSVATHVADSATLTGTNSPEFIEGLRVSEAYLRVLQVAPMLGHDFAKDADSYGGEHNVIILSYRMWVTHFNRDPAAINRTIVLDGIPHTIIGVLPASGIPRSDAAFLRPFVVDDPNDPGSINPRVTWVSVIGRLKSGATPQQLESELGNLQHSLREQLPVEMRDYSGPTVVPFREQLTKSIRPTLAMLLVIGCLLLGIACANFTSLLLVRATGRRKETAVRMALGAGVRRIIGHFLAESLILSLCGAALAVVFTLFAVDILGPITEAVQPGLSNVQRIMRAQLLGSSLPAMFQPHVNWVVLTYSLILAVLTGSVAGLIPALRCRRIDLVHDLNLAGRGNSGGPNRTQSFLVIGQIALATMLLVGSGLLLRSLHNELAVDPGFDGARTVGFDLITPRNKYPDTKSAVQLGSEVMRRLQSLPEVEAVGTTHNPPFRGIGYQEIRLPGAEENQFLVVSHSAVAGDYFRAMDIRVLRGRAFVERDNLPGSPPVIILSETLAHALFGDADPVGKWAVHNGNRQIIGVVADVRERSLEMPGESHFYIPNRDNPWTPTVVVRTKGSPAMLLQTIRKSVEAIDPDQPLAHLNPLQEDIGRTLRGKEAMLRLVFLIAAGAVFLASVGVYSLLAFAVGERQRELGIKMALGASRPNVLKTIFADGMRLTFAGVSIGLIAAATGARLIQSLLFGVSAYDPAVFITIAIILCTVAGMASWLPARRATKVDPLVALRAD